MSGVAESRDLIAQKIAHTAEITGATTAVGSSVGFSQGWLETITQYHDLIWAAGIAIGAAVGIAGLAIQFFFARKRNCRERERHELEMKVLKSRLQSGLES